MVLTWQSTVLSHTYIVHKKINTQQFRGSTSTKWLTLSTILGPTGEKPLEVKQRNNNKLNQHNIIASMQGFEPEPCWWEVSALTTALSKCFPT